MKGIRFYEELTNKNRKAEKSQGTVIAVGYETWYYGYRSAGVIYECMAALYPEANSPAVGSSVSRGYLAESCRRISEAKAREIHPLLFERLDD